MKKTAFSTGAFYTLETADALAKIRKAGFEHAELMPQCQEDLSPVMLRKTDQIGIHISSIHYPLVYFGILYNANPGMFRESKAFSDNLASFAKAAGTEFVVIHPEEEYKAKSGEIKCNVKPRFLVPTQKILDGDYTIPRRKLYDPGKEKNSSRPAEGFQDIFDDGPLPWDE